jgi:hypothetical protein
MAMANIMNKLRQSGIIMTRCKALASKRRRRRQRQRKVVDSITKSSRLCQRFSDHEIPTVDMTKESRQGASNDAYVRYEDGLVFMGRIVARIYQLGQEVERSNPRLPFLQRFVLGSRLHAGINDLKQHQKRTVWP